MSIPQSHVDLLERASYWHVATIGPKGEPQSSPVWAGLDEDGHVVISMLAKRQKVRNLRANPAVALSAIDPDNAYRYLELRGAVMAIDDEPDHELIDAMAKKYMGVDEYPFRQPGDERVTIRIEVEHANTMG